MKKNLNWLNIYIISCVLIGLLTVGVIILYILALILYGNTPVTEIPAWAACVLIGR